MYKYDSQNSSKFKGLHPLQLSGNTTGKCLERGYYFGNKTIFMKYLIFFLMFIVIQSKAWCQTSVDDLIGYWEGVIIPGENSIYEFSVEKHDKNQWDVTLIADDTIRKSITLNGSSNQVEFPQWQVTFVGAINETTTSIDGFWKREKYTRPLSLNKVSQNKWTSHPRPTKKDFVILLKLFLNDDGYLTGEVHNRDNNMGNYIPIKKVHLTENKLQFEMEYSTGYELRGIYKENKLILESKRGNNWHPFAMERIQQNKVLYDKPLLKDHEYSIPESNSDGWSVSSLTGEGIEEQSIINFMNDIKDEKYPHLHSITIIKNDKLVLDEYFYDHHSSEIHEIRSVTKPFASALVGIAIDKGLIQSVDDPIWRYLGQYDNIKNLDPRKEAITIKDLLTMSSGLDNDDNDPSSSGSEMKMKRQVEQQDWVKFNLDLPMIEKAGQTFRYSSGGMNIISAVIEGASGKSITNFITQYLFEPLVITDYQLSHSPDGRIYLGGDFKLKPRDLAKFGQLYLSDGTWNGKQILSTQWVKESTMVQVEQTGYGFAWWLPPLSANGKNYKSIYVGGNGGQAIIIVPELDLVAVFTGGNFNYDLFDTRRIVEKHIIPAMD